MNQPQTPDNEVARLRELNEKLRTLASNAIEALYATADPRNSDPIKFRAELAALAPAPEEPTIKESLTVQTECQDCGVPLATAEQINKKCSPCMMAITELLGTTMDEWYGGFSKIESTEPDNDVAKLKEIIMDAARRGDEMAANWKERAEKAEAIIKQLHHYVKIIEGFQNTANK